MTLPRVSSEAAWSAGHREEQEPYCARFVAPMIAGVELRRLSRAHFAQILGPGRHRLGGRAHLHRCCSAMVAAGPGTAGDPVARSMLNSSAHRPPAAPGGRGPAAGPPRPDARRALVPGGSLGSGPGRGASSTRPTSPPPRPSTLWPKPPPPAGPGVPRAGGWAFHLLRHVFATWALAQPGAPSMTPPGCSDTPLFGSPRTCTSRPMATCSSGSTGRRSR
jgi:hypothetical protein